MADTSEQVSQSRTRGELVVAERAAIKVIEGAFARNVSNVSPLSVRIMSMSDDAVEFQVTVATAYPTAPITSVLASIRRAVALEVERQLSRSVTRFDLTISGFNPPKPASRRVS